MKTFKSLLLLQQIRIATFLSKQEETPYRLNSNTHSSPNAKLCELPLNFNRIVSEITKRIIK